MQSTKSLKVVQLRGAVLISWHSFIPHKMCRNNELQKLHNSQKGTKCSLSGEHGQELFPVESLLQSSSNCLCGPSVWAICLNYHVPSILCKLFFLLCCFPLNERPFPHPNCIQNGMWYFGDWPRFVYTLYLFMLVTQSPSACILDVTTSITLLFMMLPA